MKKHGFTLIELLAVIVILAVIALITTPMVLVVIDKARKSAYKDTIYGIIESANIYLASNLGSTSRSGEIVFTCDGVSCANSEGEKLNFKGTVPKSGSFYINGKGEITVESVYNGRYYANTVDDDIEITDTDTTLTRAELTALVKELQQEVRELKQEVNTKSDTSQIANLTSRHESDVTSIWNKVGTEDLSSISDGSISKILIENNELVSDLNELITSQGTTINNLQTTVNQKADNTSLNNLSSQVTTLSGTINNHTTAINNLNTSLNSKANSSHTHDDRYYTESEIDTKFSNVTTITANAYGIAWQFVKIGKIVMLYYEGSLTQDLPVNQSVYICDGLGTYGMVSRMGNYAAVPISDWNNNLMAIETVGNYLYVRAIGSTIPAGSLLRGRYIYMTY